MEIPTLNSDPQWHLAAGKAWKLEDWSFLVDAMLSAARMGFWHRTAIMQYFS